MVVGMLLGGMCRCSLSGAGEEDTLAIITTAEVGHFTVRRAFHGRGHRYRCGESGLMAACAGAVNQGQVRRRGSI